MTWTSTVPGKPVVQGGGDGGDGGAFAGSQPEPVAGSPCLLTRWNPTATLFFFGVPGVASHRILSKPVTPPCSVFTSPLFGSSEYGTPLSVNLAPPMRLP